MNPETPQQLLQRASHIPDTDRLILVAENYIEKWTRLDREYHRNLGTPHALDGRANIYTGETYAEARDRWTEYRDLLLQRKADEDATS